jgi:hypothetical protein
VYTSIIHQQLWGYKVEEKLHLGVRKQRRLNPGGYTAAQTVAFRAPLLSQHHYCHSTITLTAPLLSQHHYCHSTITLTAPLLSQHHYCHSTITVTAPCHSTITVTAPLLSQQHYCHRDGIYAQYVHCRVLSTPVNTYSSGLLPVTVTTVRCLHYVWPSFGRLCGRVVRVPGYTTEMYCVSCEVRTEFIYVM